MRRPDLPAKPEKVKPNLPLRAQANAPLSMPEQKKSVNESPASTNEFETQKSFAEKSSPERTTTTHAVKRASLFGSFQRLSQARQKHLDNEPETENSDQGTAPLKVTEEESLGKVSHTAAGRLTENLGSVGQHAQADELGKKTRNRINTAELPVSLQDRLIARQRARRRRILWRVLAAILVGVLLIVLGWALFFSSLLALNKVQVNVKGSLLDKAQIEQVINIQKGKSLLRISDSAVEKQLRAKFVAIGGLEFKRSYPHSLTVDVQQRVVVGFHKDAKNIAMADVIDAQGTVFGQLPVKDPLVAKAIEFHLESSGEDAQRHTRTLMRIYQEIPAALRSQVKALSISKEGMVGFSLATGPTVVWGSDADNALKAEVLKLLLKQPARVYDVSTPRNPATR